MGGDILEDQNQNDIEVPVISQEVAVDEIQVGDIEVEQQAPAARQRGRPRRNSVIEQQEEVIVPAAAQRDGEVEMGDDILLLPLANGEQDVAENVHIEHVLPQNINVEQDSVENVYDVPVPFENVNIERVDKFNTIVFNIKIPAQKSKLLDLLRRYIATI